MSKYFHYSDEEKRKASEIDLVAFLQHKGEKLKRFGKEYRLIYSDGSGTHDSITVSGNRWYDHKNQCGGGPVTLLKEYYGMSYQEAMEELLGRSSGFAYAPSDSFSFSASENERKKFAPPEANDNMRRTFAYLTKQRFIDPYVISFFAHNKSIYEDKAHHNVVFVGKDENGIPRQAHQRSTTSYGGTFRITVEGSDTRYSFAHFGKSDKLFVFEAPIDLLSFISAHNKNHWQEHSYIAMNGVYESAVLQALESHPDLQSIYICTDCDTGGIDAADRLRDILREKGYIHIERIKSLNKDWNEDLKMANGVEPIPRQKHERIDKYCAELQKLKYESILPRHLVILLNSNLKSKSYRELAAYSLSSACSIAHKFFSDARKENEIFEILRKGLQKSYRAYQDKGKIGTKEDELGKAVKGITEKLTKTPAATRQGMQEIARQLVSVGVKALSCQTELMMSQTEQAQSQQDSPSDEEDESEQLEIAM